MTVRLRLLLSSLFAIIALPSLALSISLRSDHATRELIETLWDNLWRISALEQNHLQLLDLAQQTKAQLLPWDEVDAQFQAIRTSIENHWQDLGARRGVGGWYAEVTPERYQVSDFLDGAFGWYRVGSSY